MLTTVKPIGAATYQFTGVRPLNVHSSIELYHRCAVQGEGLPHYQLDWVLRKQLDIVNLTSCPGKRKGGVTEGRRQRERSRWHRQQFFLPHRTRGNDFPLGPEEPSHYKEAVCHGPALFPFMCQAMNQWGKLKWKTVKLQLKIRDRESFVYWPGSLIVQSLETTWSFRKVRWWFLCRRQWLFKRSISAQSEGSLSVSPLTVAAVTFGPGSSGYEFPFALCEVRNEWSHTTRQKSLWVPQSLLAKRRNLSLKSPLFIRVS